jgi:hypothetical protein
VLLLDAREHRGVCFDEFLSALNAIRGGHAVGELQECLREHPLPAIDIDDALIIGKRRCSSGNRALGNTLPAASRSKLASQPS